MVYVENPWKGWKTTVEQGGISLTLLSSLLCENESFSLYSDGVLSKREVFFSTSLSYKFSTLFSNFLSWLRGMLPGTKRRVSNHDSSIWIPIQLLYYIMTGVEIVSMQSQGSGMEGNSAITWGSILDKENFAIMWGAILQQGKGHQGC